MNDTERQDEFDPRLEELFRREHAHLPAEPFATETLRAIAADRKRVALRNRVLQAVAVIALIFLSPRLIDVSVKVSAGLDELCRHAAMCLGTRSGRLLLAHLQRSFLDRRVPPTASDAELRHAEGQRSVVHHLLQLAERGRGEPATVAPPPATGVSP